MAQVALKQMTMVADYGIFGIETSPGPENRSDVSQMADDHGSDGVIRIDPRHVLRSPRLADAFPYLGFGLAHADDGMKLVIPPRIVPVDRSQDLAQLRTQILLHVHVNHLPPSRPAAAAWP